MSAIEAELEKVASNKKPIDFYWERIDKGLFLNKRFLRYGFILISNNEKYFKLADKTEFKVNGSTILNIKKSQQIALDKTQNNYKKALSFLTQLVDFSKDPLHHSSLRLMNTGVYFENEKKGDVFISMSSNIKERDASFFYISPSMNDDPETFRKGFSGVKRFVSAGCLFGSSLQGIDIKGALFPIIQHKINFVEGEKIIDLELPIRGYHPYEIAQFSFLNDFLPIMERMANKGQHPELLYHLPSIDYILSGIKLFIQNKISYDSLFLYYSEVIKRAKQHEKKIRDIFKSSNIEVSIESPFINLLGDFCRNDDYQFYWMENPLTFKQTPLLERSIYLFSEDETLHYRMLDLLNNIVDGNLKYSLQEYPVKSNATTAIEEEVLTIASKNGHVIGLNALLHFLEIPLQKKPFANQKQIEKRAVAKILDALSENGYSIEHRDVWRSVLSVNTGKDRICNLESLFKIANAAMLAIAAKNMEDHEVCSFLPLNERPIYFQYLNTFHQSLKYPQVLSLLVLERLICYSRLAEGNVFYFQSHSSILENALRAGALTNTHQGLAFFDNRQNDKASKKNESKAITRTLSF